MELSKLIGIAGLILAIIEIWVPKASEALESYFDKKTTEVYDFQNEIRSYFKLAAKHADNTMKEVMKGPQLITPSELKVNFIISLMNTKMYFTLYAAFLTNSLFLVPMSNTIKILNHIGKGKIVGGMGIVLASVGIML